ncbi:GFA family protein [Sphingomonas canadensis]|uniref:GFA family protein n=1 Tax=Sphingomonas canadensis TaxID=1219257 RepID=A0ABW3H611_9SPHN|nr:GFA family protein [Sphingomonas canadensis]MCW3835366.1 GFA family protein [Sphingomonas canadensis]
MLSGGCHCGVIRYEMDVSDVRYSALCHCDDCRRHSGAPMVAWSLVPHTALAITGDPATYASSANAVRHFCAACGTGLFYTNATVFPGMIDVQTATLDDPDALPPQIHVQVADRPAWGATMHALPAFDRYPG